MLQTQMRPTTGENRYWFKRAAEHVKLEVPISRYLEASGVQVRGSRARCLIHGGRNQASFVILNGGKKFFCHSCQKSGDIIDLVTLVEKHADNWTALVSLKENFGLTLPGPRQKESWSKRQEEKATIRDQVFETLVQSYQRRYFRVFGDLVLEHIEDPVEREEEGRRLFEDFGKVARVAARNRMDR